MNVFNPLTPLRGDILGTVKIATNYYGDRLIPIVENANAYAPF